MESEEPVVSGRLDQRSLRFDQVQAHESCCGAADKEKEGNRSEVQPGDSFVVGGKEPRLPPVAGVEMWDLRKNGGFRHSCTHCCAAFRPSPFCLSSDLI